MAAKGTLVVEDLIFEANDRRNVGKVARSSRPPERSMTGAKQNPQSAPTPTVVEQMRRRAERRHPSWLLSYWIIHRTSIDR